MHDVGPNGMGQSVWLEQWAVSYLAALADSDDFFYKYVFLFDVLFICQKYSTDVF